MLFDGRPKLTGVHGQAMLTCVRLTGLTPVGTDPCYWYDPKDTGGLRGGHGSECQPHTQPAQEHTGQWLLQGSASQRGTGYLFLCVGVLVYFFSFVSNILQMRKQPPKSCNARLERMSLGCIDFLFLLQLCKGQGIVGHEELGRMLWSCPLSWSSVGEVYSGSCRLIFPCL